MTEIGEVKEQNEKLQSSVEQQQKETEHLKVCESYSVNNQPYLSVGLFLDQPRLHVCSDDLVCMRDNHNLLKKKEKVTLLKVSVMFCDHYQEMLAQLTKQMMTQDQILAGSGSEEASRQFEVRRTSSRSVMMELGPG